MADNILDLILRIRKQGTGAKDAEKEFKGLEGTVKGLGGAAQMLAGSAALGAVIAGLKFCIDEAREAQKVMAVTEATIKATGGAAGLSATQVGEIASELERMTLASAESIQEGQNMLLTFKEIKGDNFERASAAMLDMAVAMNKGNLEGADMKGTAIQLGKALNVTAGDTAAASKALSALGRAGVSFTSAQKAAALAAIEMGDVAAFQAIVLGELESEFGGVAAAAGRAEGPLKRLSVIGGNVAEAFGARLIPWLDGAAQGFLNLLKLGGALDIQFRLMVGTITQEEAAAKAAALANDDLAGYLFGTDEAAQAVTTSTDAAASATLDLAGATADEAAAMEGAAEKAGTYAARQNDAAKALENLQAKQAGWASSTGQDVINALNAAGVEGQEYTAALIAADTVLGTSFAQDEEKKKKLDDLAKAYADGKISAQEFGAGVNLLTAKDMPEVQAAFAASRDRAAEFDEQTRRLDGRRVQVLVDTIYRSFTESATFGVHDQITENGKATLGGRQAGGPVMVGERGAEMFWPQSNGYVMNNNDMRRMITALEAIASGGGGRGGVVNMSINTQAAPSETMVGGYLRALAGAL